MNQFRIGILLVSLGVGNSIACAAEQEWRAFLDHGDKPGNAIVLHVNDKVISGEFYITSPDDFKNLSSGPKYSITDIKSEGKLLVGSASVINLSRPSGKQEIKLIIKFETPLEGERVKARLCSREDDEGQELVFERTKEEGKK